MTGSTTSEIERQLTILFRRVQRIHISTASGEMDLERSAYGIMCQLADLGPQRLGALAQKFGLDPSTITRQVQALESAELVERSTDPADRRASILDLTDEGNRVLLEVRASRRQRLDGVLEGWSASDRSEFSRLLEKFNSYFDTGS